jgi:hypothetical protein
MQILFNRLIHTAGQVSFKNVLGAALAEKLSNTLCILFSFKTVYIPLHLAVFKTFLKLTCPARSYLYILYYLG